MTSLPSLPVPAVPSQVSAAILRAVHSALRAQGFGAQVTPALPPLEQPEAHVAWEDCLERLRVVLGITRDPAIGLAAGERATIGALHVVGHVLISCRNLREAIQVYLRFAPLVFAGAGFALREQGDTACFVFTPPPCEGDSARFVAEFGLTIAKGVGELFCASFADPRFEVRFRHTRPAYASEYDRVFGCAVSFDQTENALVMPRHVLDVPYVYADEGLKQMLAARAERLLERQLGSSSPAHRVRQVLRGLDLDGVDLDLVAKQLGLSTHVLQRRLREQGVTFSGLLDDVRRDLACEALRYPESCIKALSERLGFSEPCAFHRAFRRWTGTTPARYRERLLKNESAISAA